VQNQQLAEQGETALEYGDLLPMWWVLAVSEWIIDSGNGDTGKPRWYSCR